MQAKWKCIRNVIYATVRFLEIQKQIVLFGTSERLLDMSRGVQALRDYMLPDSTTALTVSKEVLVPDCLMLRHDGLVLKTWSGVVLLLLLYTATVMPYCLALVDDSQVPQMFYIDTCIDLLFLLDVIINFNSPI